MWGSAAGIKRIVLLAPLLAAGVLLILLPGCMSSELNQKSLVSMVGVDRTDEGGLKLTVGFIGTNKQGAGDKETVTVYSSEGPTLMDAARGFIGQIGNQPLWPYIKLLIIGPSLSEEDVSPVLDFFNRNNEMQPNPFVVFSKKTAAEAVNLPTDLPTLPAHVIERQIKNQSMLAHAPQVTLYEFNEMMFTPDKVGMAPLLTEASDKGKPIHSISGMAVLKHGRKIGIATARETRGVLWVQRQVKGGVLVIPLPGAEGFKETNREQKVSLEILGRNKSVTAVSIKGTDDLSLSVSIKCKLAVGEVLGYMPVNHNQLTLLEQEAQAEIREEVEAAVKKAQNTWKTDIFGFDRMVERALPDYWQSHKDQWQDIFAELPIDVDVDVRIQKYGLFDSFTRKKGS